MHVLGRCVLAGQGQVQRDTESSAVAIGELDSAAVRLGDLARERKAQPGTALASAAELSE